MFNNFFKKEIIKEEKTYPNIILEKDDNLETIGEWFGLSTKKIDRDEIRKRIANISFDKTFSGEIRNGNVYLYKIFSDYNYKNSILAYVLKEIVEDIEPNISLEILPFLSQCNPLLIFL